MLVGLLLAALQVAELVEQLKVPRTAAHAESELDRCSPAELAAVLTTALAQDPGFAPGKNARHYAFRVLAQSRTVRGEGKLRVGVVDQAAQVALLKMGMRDEYSSTRACCVRSIGDWDALLHEEGVRLLSRSLEDENGFVRLEACRAAGEVGSAAAPLLDRLEELLVGKDQEGGPISWLDRSGPGGIVERDRELSGRLHAANARMRIAGVATDRQRYEVLDETGKDGLAAAWSSFAFHAMLEHLEAHAVVEEKCHPDFLSLKEHPDLILRALERPRLFLSDNAFEGDAVIPAIAVARICGLFQTEHRQVLHARIEALCADESVGEEDRSRLRALEREFQ